MVEKNKLVRSVLSAPPFRFRPLDHMISQTILFFLIIRTISVAAEIGKHYFARTRKNFCREITNSQIWQKESGYLVYRTHMRSTDHRHTYTFLARTPRTSASRFVELLLMRMRVCSLPKNYCINSIRITQLWQCFILSWLQNQLVVRRAQTEMVISTAFGAKFIVATKNIPLMDENSNCFWGASWA